MDDRFNGVVAFFNNAGRYGFIRGQDGRDVFVHASQIGGEGYRTLVPGQAVSYCLRPGRRGLQACDVRRSEDDEKSVYK